MHFGLPAEIFGLDGVIVLVIVVLVLFGSTQIPKLARSLGSAQKEFKKGLDEGSQEAGTSVASATPPPAVAPPVQVVVPPAQPVPPAAPPAQGSTGNPA